MKTIISLLSTLVILIIIALLAIFTPYGSNTVLKPIINKKIHSEISKPKITIDKFDSKLSYLDVVGNVDNKLKFRALGDVNYFKKSFNLNYTLNAKEIKIEDKEYNPNLHISGKAVGNIKHFKVNGEGKAFGSNLYYKSIVKNNQPQVIEAKIKDAKVAQLLAIAGVNPILNAIANIDINMPNLDINNPQGKAYIELKNGILNRKLIKQAYGILIPKNEHIDARIIANVVKKYIVAKGKILSTTANIDIQKLTTTPDFKILKAISTLDIAKLSRLNSITKLKLRGKLKANGVFYANLPKKIYQANLTTKSFGGSTKIKYKNDSVNAILKDVNMVKVLSTLSLPHFVTKGAINAVVDIPNLKKLNGDFVIYSKGVLNKRLFKVSLPSYKYIIKSKGSLKNGVIYAKNSSLDSTIAKLILSNSKFTILTQAFSSRFNLNINNLSSLNSLTNNNLRGSLKLNGVFKKAGKNVSLDAKTSSLGGDLNIQYSNNRLKSTFKNILLPKLLYKINQPAYLKSGYASGNINISSLSALNGIINISANGLVDNALLKKLYNIDLSSQLKYKMDIKDAVISKGVIKAKPHIISSLLNIDFPLFIYDTNSGNIKAKYVADILDLSKFNSITKQKLSGSAQISGEVKIRDNNRVFSGLLNKFGGTTNFYLKNNQFTLNSAGVNIIEVLALLNKPKNIDGVAKVDLKYNLDSKKGNFNATIDEVRFLNSKLVTSLKRFLNFDLSKEIFQSAKIDGTIEGDIINFNLHSSSQRVKIVIENGIFNNKEETINARAIVTLNHKDYYVKIIGKSSNPNFRLEFKGAVKDKVVNVVKKKVLHKLGLDDINSSESEDILNKADKNISNIKEKAKEKIEEKVEDKVKKAMPKEVKGLLKGLFK